jgi:predicted nucleic acid-binding protein
LTLLDASALLSLLLRQPAAPEVKALLHEGRCAIPAPCLTEVIDLLVRRHGREEKIVVERVGPLLDEAVPVIPTDRRIAWRAGLLHAEYYHRRDAALSLADCVLLASAGASERIASSDRRVLATAEALGIATVALLDSGGRRPEAD